MDIFNPIPAMAFGLFLLAYAIPRARRRCFPGRPAYIIASNFFFFAAWEFGCWVAVSGWIGWSGVRWQFFGALLAGFALMGLSSYFHDKAIGKEW